MTVDRAAANKTLLKKIIRLFESGDVSDVDVLIDVKYVDHQGLGGTELTGTGGFWQVVSAARIAMPELHVAVEDLVTEGDRIVARLRWRGKSVAGQELERQTIDVLRIEGGRLAEHWGGLLDAPGKDYRPTDWIDPRIEIRPSSIHGRGMFATALIQRGEVVTVWGGAFVLTDRDRVTKRALGALGYTLGTIGEGLYLVAMLREGEEDVTNLINHSCDPNVWMHDEVTLAARRDIAAGEELTMDYAVIEGSEDWVGLFECRCGSPLCRGRFTGKDWRREDLQARYGGHFSPFINERIRGLRGRGPR
jgi:predicted ester cyclase